jgi:hypothetical protein
MARFDGNEPSMRMSWRRSGRGWPGSARVSSRSARSSPRQWTRPSAAMILVAGCWSLPISAGTRAGEPTRDAARMAASWTSRSSWASSSSRYGEARSASRFARTRAASTLTFASGSSTSARRCCWAETALPGPACRIKPITAVDRTRASWSRRLSRRWGTAPSPSRTHRASTAAARTRTEASRMQRSTPSSAAVTSADLV